MTFRYKHDKPPIKNVHLLNPCSGTGEENRKFYIYIHSKNLIHLKILCSPSLFCSRMHKDKIFHYHEELLAIPLTSPLKIETKMLSLLYYSSQTFPFACLALEPINDAYGHFLESRIIKFCFVYENLYIHFPLHSWSSFSH